MNEKAVGFKHYPKYFNPYIILILLTLLVRFVFITRTGYVSDVDTFKAWASMLADSGLGSFYYLDSFTDYPPAYMYFLFVIGKIYEIFSIDITGTLATIIIKLPAIFFDLATVLFIYKISSKKFESSDAFKISLFYALNPAIFLDSAIWGQVDSIYTFVIFVSLYLATKSDSKNLIYSFVLFTVALLLKPQALIFAPVYLFLFGNYFYNETSFKESMKTFAYILCACVVTFMFICLPFVNGFDFSVIIKQYIGTIDQYDYQTLNAYNFYGFIGNNMAEITRPIFYGLSAQFVGIFSVVFFSIVTMMFLYKNSHNKFSIFLGASFINLTTFLFCIKMHERYLFPTLLFLLVSYIYSKDKRLLRLFFGFSFTFYVNCFDVLKLSLYDYDYDVLRYGLPVISFINLALFCYMFYIIFEYMIYRTHDDDFVNEDTEFSYEVLEPKPEDNLVNVSKKDIRNIVIITFIYSIVALYNLGTTENPKTYGVFNSGDVVTFNFDGEKDISQISILNGTRENKNILFSNGEENYKDLYEMDKVFKWHTIPVDRILDHITVTIPNDETYIQEIGFIDANDETVEIKSIQTNNEAIKDDAEKIADEQENIPRMSIYQNSTYFDEIYHPRTGFEFANQLKVYENTHPPLGKDFMAIMIDIFGMSPFYYRLPGVIAGILMIPFMYLLSLNMFKKSEFAVFSSLLLSLDFMHFSQTRLATIDSFVTLFVLIMFYYMYKYYSGQKTYKNLLLSGIFMGLAVATKWTGVYFGIGLGIVFFISVFSDYKRYLFEQSVYHTGEVHEFKQKTIKTLSYCLLFFVLIPIIIYGLSYFYYLQTPSGTNGIMSIIENQEGMLSYHSGLFSTHPYASDYWTWLLDIRPVYYYSNTFSNGNIAGISGFGNPLIWWVGTLCLFFTFSRLKTDNRKNALFLLVAYFAGIVPWIFVTRTMYMYHYFPCTIFMILMITNFVEQFFGTTKNKYVIIYLCLVFICFVLFYPVLSGMPVPNEYVKMLRWLPTWALGPVY